MELLPFGQFTQNTTPPPVLSASEGVGYLDWIWPNRWSEDYF
jgi:hypothetical protein